MPEFSVSVELVDDYNRTARKTFVTTPTTVDFAAAATAAADLMVDLAVLTELRVLAYTVSQRITMVDEVTAGGNKDEGVTFTLRKVDLFKDDIKVPGPINSIFDENGNVITAPSIPAPVLDFLGHFQSPGGTFTFSDGEQWVEFIKGVLDV